jgi:hypothetical protein
MKQLLLSILFISVWVAVFGSINGVTRSSFIRHQLSETGQQNSGLNREAFYKAMQENNKALVNIQLEELKTEPDAVRQAFMGAMLMKRAGFVGSAGAKLHYFKEGHKMLEAAIKRDPDNAEFRFLRLMVQEHAPGVLGYKEEIEKDSQYIRKYYKSLPDEVQRVIEDYSKKSKFLKLDVS